MASEYDILFAEPEQKKQPVQGQLEAGNIDLTNRPVVENPDGSISTVRSISSNIDGQEVLLPTIADDGRTLSNDEAINLYRESGKHLGKFDTPENATAFAQQLHEDQAARHGRPGSKKGGEYDILFQEPAKPEPSGFKVGLSKALDTAVNLGVRATEGLLPESVQYQIFGRSSSGIRKEENIGPLVSRENVRSFVGDLPAIFGGNTAVGRGLAEGTTNVLQPLTSPEEAVKLPQFLIPGVAETFALNTAAEIPNQIDKITKTIQEHGAGSVEAGTAIAEALGADIMGAVAAKTGTGARVLKAERAIRPTEETRQMADLTEAAPPPAEAALPPVVAEPAPVVAETAPIGGVSPEQIRGTEAPTRGAQVSEGDIAELRASNARRLAEGEEVPIEPGSPESVVAAQVSPEAPKPETAFLTRDQLESEVGARKSEDLQKMQTENPEGPASQYVPVFESPTGAIIGEKGQTHADLYKKALTENPDAYEAITKAFENDQTHKFTKVTAGERPAPEPVAAAEEIAAAPTKEVVTEIADAAPEQTAAVERVSTNTEQANYIGAQAELARNRLEEPAGAGPGAASAAEFPLLRDQNAREYASIGAQHLLEGKGDKASWVEAMRDEYGIRDASPAELNRIWNDAHELLRDFEAAQRGKEPRTKTQIEQATGIRTTEEPTVKESAALKTKLQAEQKASQEAYKQGKREARESLSPIIQRLRDTLDNSVNKARALAEYLRGTEKGGEAGRKARERELQMSDRWISADQEKVRQDLTDYVNQTLPPGERGRFIGAITRALRRPDLVKGDPSQMFRNAFRVMRAIESRAEEVYKGGVIEDIKTTLNRTIDSPGVDVDYRQRIKAATDQLSPTKPRQATIESLKKLNDYVQKLRAAGQEVRADLIERVGDLSKIPLQDLSIASLEALRTKIQLLEKLGRQRVKNREIARQKEKANKIAEMRDQVATKLEDNPIFKPQPGEKGEMGIMQRVGNWLNAGRNTASLLEKAHAPIDEIFDLLDGAKALYNGWLMRNIRGPVDLGFNAEVVEGNALRGKLREIRDKHRLTTDDFHQLFVYAASKMEGGKERLMEQGVTKDTIKKAENISPGQKEYYDAVRGMLDKDLLPRLIEQAKALDNKEVKPLKDYVPFQLDWVEKADKDTTTPGELSFAEDATTEQILNDIGFQRLSTKTKQGFLERRQEGAKTPLKTNFEDVIDRHINDVLHYLHVQPELRAAGDVVRAPEFQKKYGKAGQTIVLDWLDTVARQGGVNRLQRLRTLDWFRNATSKAQVGYRLASNLVHSSQAFYAMNHAGGVNYWTRGMKEALTPEGQAFLKEHAAETTRRSGGEPAQAEVEALSGKFTRGGFYIARNLDRLNSQATFLGRYFKEMEKQGISPEQALQLPVDKAAQATSLVRMRRAVASPLYKDVPQALSRGLGYNANVSIARAVNQFRNIFLDNWSNIRHDFFRAGVADAVKNGLDGDNASKIAAIAAVTMMSIAAETGIKYGVKKGIKSATAAATGGPEPEDHGAVEELKHHALNRIPIVGQAMNAAMYGQTGVPIIDALVKPVWEIGKFFKSSKPQTKARHALEAAGAAATLTGIPGVGQAADITEQVLVPKVAKKGASGFEILQ